MVRLSATSLAVFVFTAFCNFTAAGETASISRSGDITGTINFCGLGGLPGILVHIPGRSFAARTDDQGGFVLNYVPAGSHTLIFAQGDESLGRKSAVLVQAKRVTDLGTLNLCTDDATCPAIFDPVCGADGVTYSNACEAARAGVEVAAPGECV
jgi:hypothetical protein